MQLSWGLSDVHAIFYANDTLSPSLLREAGRGSHSRAHPAATAGSAQDTGEEDVVALARAAKLFAANDTAAIAGARAAAAAARALAVAREVQALLLAAARQEQPGNGAPNRSAYADEVQPLPILQYRVSPECFAGEPLMRRVRAASAADAASSGAALDFPFASPPCTA